jgi:GST-like protein
VIEEPALNEPNVAFRAAAVNPMRQVPSLVLPSGEIMTESSAILAYLADHHPAAGLSPSLEDPARPQFLRWMAYVSAAIYSLYWIRDDLSGLAADKTHEAVIGERTAERIVYCWRLMDEQVAPGRYILGDDMTVLDIYVAAVSRWGPQRRCFYEVGFEIGEGGGAWTPLRG